MDYKEKYEAIVGWLKKYADEGMNITPSDIRISVPELSESEDERIIDGFHTLLKGIRRDGGLTLNKVPLDKCEEWLEKQKEQNPAEWSEEDEQMILDIVAQLKAAISLTYAHDEQGKAVMEQRISWLKSLRPQPHWKPSEEQMDALGTAVSISQSTALESLYNDLKELM